MVAKLHAIKAELRLRMHEPVVDVGAWLRKVVNGDYRYHAVPGNLVRLSVFGQRLRRLWRRILRRRSQRPMSWNRTTRIFKRWIPAPHVLHPYPLAQLASSPLNQGGSRMRKSARTVLYGGAISHGRPYRDQVPNRWRVSSARRDN